MAVKFFSKQSPNTEPPQFYKASLLSWLLIVIVINVVIGGFSEEDLKWLAHVTVRLQVSNCNDYNLQIN